MAGLTLKSKTDSNNYLTMVVLIESASEDAARTDSEEYANKINPNYSAIASCATDITNEAINYAKRNKESGE